MDLRFAPGFKMLSHRQFCDYFDGKQIYPINIEISPSGICNANCPNCFYRQDNQKLRGMDRDFINEGIMLELIYDLNFLGIKSISWTGGGEPTLHDEFPTFVMWVNNYKIQQGLFTNALQPIYYDPTLFEWIRVTKTNTPINKENLQELRRCKTLGICLNYSENDDKENIWELLEIAEELGLDYVQVRPALKIKGERREIKIPKIKHPLLQITDYKFMCLESERNYTDCEAYHFSPFIWQNGDVDVCGYHKGEKEFNLGNLYDKGEKGTFKYIMDNAPKSVKVAKNCQVCCKLNDMNSVIQMRKELKDINFP